jgi:hypothetical protein
MPFDSSKPRPRNLHGRLGALVAPAALAAVVACGSAGSDATPSDQPVAQPSAAAPVAQNTPPRSHVTPEGIITGRFPGFSVPKYNGGTIMSGPISVIPIFYGTAWQTNYQSTVLAFLSTMSSSSYWQVVEEYADSAGHHPGAVNVGTPVYDTTYTYGKTITNQTVLQIAQAVPNSLPGQNIYMVFTADDVNVTQSPILGGSLCVDFLGWHNQGTFDWVNGNFVTNTFTAAFALIGSPQFCLNNPQLGAGSTVDAGPGPSAWNSSPNGTAIDEAISAVLHESAESATDPDTHSGYSPEIGDICAWEPGPLTEAKIGRFPLWNYDLGNGVPYTTNQDGYAGNDVGSTYLVQTIWDTTQNGCAYGPKADDCLTRAAACGAATCGAVANGCGGTESCGLCSELASCESGKCVFRF